ncbi:DUF6398 domain-containing protein [Cyanobacterium aponinum]|uniref:DUF6398 domain-containing protein n=1 Tax=Cyanobacterium aponinum 0216 TaxID=2676140 RepID=A0A844GRA2_9CHRO|nr:DUF6398 domain-containing protein [Cyanobacterium aponinum]MTF38073.1 hypothetical protein [Cyanobacterium aponinum 0216]
MTFQLNKLDNLDFDEGQEIIEDYIEDAIWDFVDSPVGQEYIKTREQGGFWIHNFIEFGYMYEGYTLSTMTVSDVKTIMEYILPRKLMILNEEEVEDAIPELIAFWQYLGETHKRKTAKGIIKYLKTLENKFTAMMTDDSSGSFVKSMLMNAHKSELDMISEEALIKFLQGQSQNKISSDKNSQVSQLLEKSTIPPSMKNKYDEITNLTDDFCRNYLNDEYLEFSRKLTTVLCNYQPSPLNKGKAKSWACGIIHALGMINFLADSSFEPYMKSSELYQRFGVSESTGCGKSKQIRDLLEMSRLDQEWMMPSVSESHPMSAIANIASTLKQILDWE